MGMLLRAPYPVATGFELLSLAPALWLRAPSIDTLWQDAARTTPAVSSNDLLGAWEDISGNGRHLTQSSSGAKPTLQLSSAINGRPAIRFSYPGAAAGDFLSIVTSGLASASEVSIWAVLQWNPASHNETALFAGEQNLLGHVPYGSATYFRHAGSGLFAGANPGDLGSVPCLLNFQSTASSSKIVANGAIIATGGGASGYNPAAPGEFRLGGNLPPADWQGWGGDIGEFVIFDRALSSGESADVASLLTTEWNMPA